MTAPPKLPLRGEDNRPIRDADGKLVGIVEHAAWFCRVANEHAELVEALESLVRDPLRYNDNCIEIVCATHAGAMECVRKARAVLAKVRG